MTGALVALTFRLAKPPGMGTAQVLGQGGHGPSAERRVARRVGHPSTAEVAAVTALSFGALAVGVAIGARFGVPG